MNNQRNGKLSSDREKRAKDAFYKPPESVYNLLEECSRYEAKKRRNMFEKFGRESPDRISLQNHLPPFELAKILLGQVEKCGKEFLAGVKILGMISFSEEYDSKGKDGVQIYSQISGVGARLEMNWNGLTDSVRASVCKSMENGGGYPFMSGYTKVGCDLSLHLTNKNETSFYSGETRAEVLDFVKDKKLFSSRGCIKYALGLKDAPYGSVEDALDKVGVSDRQCYEVALKSWLGCKRGYYELEEWGEGGNGESVVRTRGIVGDILGEGFVQVLGEQVTGGAGRTALGREGEVLRGLWGLRLKVKMPEKSLRNVHRIPKRKYRNRNKNRRSQSGESNGNIGNIVYAVESDKDNIGNIR